MIIRSLDEDYFSFMRLYLYGWVLYKLLIMVYFYFGSIGYFNFSIDWIFIVDFLDVEV